MPKGAAARAQREAQRAAKAADDAAFSASLAATAAAALPVAVMDVDAGGSRMETRPGAEVDDVLGMMMQLAQLLRI